MEDTFILYCSLKIQMFTRDIHNWLLNKTPQSVFHTKLHTNKCISPNAAEAVVILTPSG